MKRYLKNDRYRMTEHEAGNVWYAVRRELNGSGGGAAGRRGMRAWRPAMATVAVLAVAVVSVVWWQDGRAPMPTQPGRSSIPYESIGVPPAPPAEKPPTVMAPCATA